MAEERLSLRPDGTLLLEFKKALKDGTRGLVLSPGDLLVRLCEAIATPSFHMVRYYREVLFPVMSLVSNVTPSPFGLRTPKSAHEPIERRLELETVLPLAMTEARRRAWEQPARGTVRRP